MVHLSIITTVVANVIIQRLVNGDGKIAFKGKMPSTALWPLFKVLGSSE